jgi:hypothetical protein
LLSVNLRKSMLSKNTNRARVKRHQPVDFYSQDSLRLIPRKTSATSGGAGGGN